MFKMKIFCVKVLDVPNSLIMMNILYTVNCHLSIKVVLTSKEYETS